MSSHHLDKHDDGVSAQEIARAIGFSKRTVLIWTGMGLLPRPKMVHAPSTKTAVGFSGRTGRWPSWAIERALRIRQLQKRGYAVRLIKEILDAEDSQAASQQSSAATSADGHAAISA
jgi:hypothetical protein